jgi:alkylation response protein AidB-like acyl-CoA dehydrogenase
MKFSFSDEQVEFRTALRRFLSDTSPTVEVRRLMETDIGYDVDVWRQMSQDLGLTAIHIPETYGGQGFGVSELAIATEEMGRALLCAPYFASTVMGATAIMKAGLEDQKQTLLPSIAAGEVIVTLAFTEAHGRWEAEAIAMTASQEDVKFVLNGTKSFVLDGHSAGIVVVVARRPGSSGTDGLSFFTVP